MTTFCTADRETSPLHLPSSTIALCPAYFSMCVQLFKCAATKNKTELWHVFVVVLIQQCPVGAEARGTGHVAREAVCIWQPRSLIGLAVVVVVAPVCLSVVVVVVDCLCFT